MTNPSFYKLKEFKLTAVKEHRVEFRPQVTCSDSGYQILKKAWESDTIELLECFYMLLLDRANKIVGVVKISQGGTAGTVVDAKIVFGAAITGGASSIILAHNHPSGNTSPSQADIDLTKKLVAAGKLLDILVLDHLIITEDNGYYSFADEGLL